MGKNGMWTNLNYFVVNPGIKGLKRLSRPDVFFYCGLWMMFLLVIGTISQKYIGLYQAQLKYFSSFVFQLYGIPLPGGRLAMGLILVSLVSRFLFSKNRNKRTLGSDIIHIGAALLLTGSFITGLFSKEAYMYLPEGEQSNILSDYHKVELAVVSSSSGKTFAAFPEELLVSNTILEGGLPFSLRVGEFMKNSEPVKRSASESDSFKGFAKIFKLERRKREKVNEANQSGLSFQIVRDGKVENYAVFERMPVSQSFLWNENSYIISLRPIRTYLSFSIELIDFKKSDYPGTNKAKSFQSIVNIVEGKTKQRRVIRMNQPLRYKSYTFYQSSFIENGDKEVSILAAVKNAGRAFPYLSSLIMCFGVLIHITFNVGTFANRKKLRKQSGV